MDKIFIPARNPEAWKPLLAEPDKQWKTGYSARALASCWQDATGFPESVKQVFADSGIGAFQDMEMLLGIPEHQVPLPGGVRPSQTDLWVLARSRIGLISIAVEGKVSEPFGPLVREWLKDASPGKLERLAFLRELLQLPDPVPEDVRYQLLHRTAAAVLEAKRFLAGHAVMLVHSFSQTHEWFDHHAPLLFLLPCSDRPQHDHQDPFANSIRKKAPRAGHNFQLVDHIVRDNDGLPVAGVGPPRPSAPSRGRHAPPSKADIINPS